MLPEMVPPTTWALAVCAVEEGEADHGKEDGKGDSAEVQSRADHASSPERCEGARFGGVW